MSFAYQPLLATVGQGGAVSVGADAGQIVTLGADVELRRFHSFGLAAASGTFAAQALSASVLAQRQLLAQTATIVAVGKTAVIERTHGGQPPTGPVSAVVRISVGL